MKEKIYLLPGLMTDKRLWKRLYPLLENRYELVHLDIPLSKDFDDIVEILNKDIKEEKANILGFSLGGYVASYFAMKYPEKVEKLLLVAATPSSTNKDHIVKREKKLKYIDEKGFKSLGLEKAISLLEKQNQEDTELAQILVDMFDDLGKEVFVTQLASTLQRIKLEDELIKLDIPTTYYYSVEDRLLNHDSIAYSKEQKHNIDFIKRVGTSHNIPLEDPKGLSEVINKWMA